MERKAVLLLVFAVVLAGCTSIIGGGEDQSSDFRFSPNDGLSLRFSSAEETYLEGEDMTFELDMENTGQKFARVKGATLAGASFLSGSTCSVNPRINPKNPRVLDGVVKAAQQPGGRTTVIWNCPYPSSLDLAEGTTDTFPASVRANYTYGGTATASLEVVPKEDFEGAGSPVSVDNTAGPVKVSIGLSSPKTVSSSGEAVITAPITVRNVGDGEVKSKVSLKVKKPRAVRCMGKDSDKVHISLVDGERTVNCRIVLPGGELKQSFRIEIETGYLYEETLGTDFTVKGLAGSPGS